MIARLEVTRGTLTEYPLAERTKNGWQNGVTFYSDAEVTKVTPLRVVHAEPQGEPSDALNLVIHAERVGTERDDPLILELADALRVTLRAAGGVR